MKKNGCTFGYATPCGTAFSSRACRRAVYGISDTAVAVSVFVFLVNVLGIIISSVLNAVAVVISVVIIAVIIADLIIIVRKKLNCHSCISS